MPEELKSDIRLHGPFVRGADVNSKASYSNQKYTISFREDGWVITDDNDTIVHTFYFTN